MDKIIFTAIETGYVIDGRAAADYSYCYTVTMQGTDTNNISTLGKYITAYLLISGVPKNEIKVTLCQMECWQFSMTTSADYLKERTIFDTDMLKACYECCIEGKTNDIYSNDKRVSILNNAII